MSNAAYLTMSFPSRKSALFLATPILLLAALLRLAQVGDLPPGLHYDEAADTIIAREIAEGRGAPIFVEAYTGKEVLFFYWAAAWMKLIGATPFAMRLAAALLGVLTVAATYWAVREMFHPRPRPLPLIGRGVQGEGIALFATVFLATSFWHVLMSRLGFRSIAEPCVQALALAALWRGLRLNRRGWLILGGALVGLNLYTYLAARLFPMAIALLFIYLIAADADHRRERLIQFALVALAAIIVFAPLGLYFLQHPAAFLTRISQVAPRAGQSAELLTNIGRALGMFFVEGDPYVRFNLPGRPLFPVLLGILFGVGFITAVIGVWRSRRSLRRAAYFFAATSTLIMLLPTALAVNEITPSNLRAIGMMPMAFVFPALGAWMLLKGWTRIWQRMKAEGGGMKVSSVFILHPSSLILILVLLIALTGLDISATYFGHYTRLPQLYYDSDGDLVEIADLLNRLDTQHTPTYVHALHYRHPTLAALARDFHTIRSITGADTIVFPPGGSLHIFAHLALPDRTWLEQYLPDSAHVEMIDGPDGQPSYAVVRLDAPPSLQPQVEQAANFGNAIELLGYNLEAAPASGGAVDVTLMWRVGAQPDRGDYAAFVELRDAWGFQWGQTDSFDYPSEQWTPGEVIVQRLRAPIAAGAPRGDYHLQIGWYAAGANQRLPRVAADGSFGGTTARLDAIAIARAAQPPDPGALVIGTQLDAFAHEGLMLLGASLETPKVSQGAPLFFTLFWRAEKALDDVPVEIRLLGIGETATGGLTTGGSATGVASYTLTTTAPVNNTYPFDQWLPGEVVADRYGLRVPADAPAGAYTLEVRVGPGEWIGFGSVRVEATQRHFGVPPIEHPLHATFGAQIELLGYDLDRNTLQPGGAITLTLVWRAVKSPDTDYTVFTHLLDAAGVQRGGKDSPPVNGAYPTSLWIADEVIADTLVIPLNADAPPGEYTLEIGLYQLESGARLPLSAGSDALRLTTLQVAP
ncbi:MAG TPA: glycosyltransferase family 39 protein [Anaerolineae bacterium]|nr:glycosyltransferase family 39 protein [Anaerolineae bacterium]